MNAQIHSVCSWKSLYIRWGINLEIVANIPCHTLYPGDFYDGKLSAFVAVRSILQTNSERASGLHQTKNSIYHDMNSIENQQLNIIVDLLLLNIN